MQKKWTKKIIQDEWTHNKHTILNKKKKKQAHKK